MHTYALQLWRGVLPARVATRGLPVILPRLKLRPLADPFCDTFLRFLSLHTASLLARSRTRRPEFSLPLTDERPTANARRVPNKGPRYPRRQTLGPSSDYIQALDVSFILSLTFALALTLTLTLTH